MNCKQYKKLPAWVVEDHNDVLSHLYRAIGSKHLPMESNVLVHFDAHPDLLLPQKMAADDVFSKEVLFGSVSIESWILPMLYAGHVSTVVWIKPPWADQMKNKTQVFHIGKNKVSGKIGLTSTENYFMSDALYAPKEDLENLKEITLHVMTLTETEIKTNETNMDSTEQNGAALRTNSDKNCERKGISDSQSNTRDEELFDLPGNSAVEKLTDILKGQKYILDIDLDFFSTQNPFLELFTDRQFSLLNKLYGCEKAVPGMEKEYTLKRQIQLDDLEKIFLHFKTNDAEVEVKNEMFQLATDLVRDIKSNMPGLIDYDLIHMAGCTCDDTELPHHVSSDEEIKYMMTATESVLSQLPKPVMVTIARSSDDEFCPVHQVDEIQRMCLSMLKTVYEEMDVHIDYEIDS